MRTRLTWAAAALAVMLLCWGAFLVAKQAALAHVAADTSAPPFLIVMHETTVSGAPPNQRASERNFFYAQRADGSRAFGNFVFAPGGSWKILARRLSLVPRRRVVLGIDKLGLKSTYAMSDAALERLVASARSSTCHRYSPYRLVGEGSLMGFHVLKFEYRYEDSSGEELHLSEWLAPNLACHAIWGRLTVKNPDGTVRAVTTRRAAYIRKGSPPSALFAIDAKYLEVPPSKLVIGGMTTTTGVPPALNELQRKKLNAIDKAYERHDLP